MELFKSGDSADLIDTVRRLLNDEGRQRQTIELTNAFVSRHSYDGFAASLKSLYERIIQK